MKKLYAAFALSMAAFTGAMGQAALTNSGSITVEGTGYIYVNGDVQINSTGSIANDGTIEVLGAWQNDRTDGAVGTNGSGAGARLVKFTGVGNLQTIASTSGKASFYNLEVASPLAITANVQTAGVGANSTNISIQNNLTFNSGVTNAHIYMGGSSLTLATGATITNGGSSHYAYFTTGSFRKKLVAGSNTSTVHDFPFYRESIGYIPATFRMNTVPVQGDELRVAFFPQANIGRIYHVGQCNLPGHPGNEIMLSKMIPNFGYWQMDVVDASATNIDNITGWNYDVTLSPTASAISGLSTDYIKILKMPSHDSQGNLFAIPTSSTDWAPFVGTSGTYCDGIALTSTYSAATGITATNLNSFSRFGGAGNDGGAGLPITLVSLNATPVENQYIYVEWVTATEVNNAGFEVQRSTDGLTFQKIGWVDGHGNTTEQLQYSLQDKDVASNTLYYYRLKQVDYNQQELFSNIVTAGIKAENVLTVSDFVPNPSSNSTRIEITSGGDSKKANISIYNTLGQIIQKDDFTVATGKTTYQFDVQQLASGTYYAIISINDKVFDKKLIVNK